MVVPIGAGVLAAVVEEALIIVAGLKRSDVLGDECVEIREVGEEVGWEGKGHAAVIGVGCHFESPISADFMVESQLSLLKANLGSFVVYMKLEVGGRRKCGVAFCGEVFIPTASDHESTAFDRLSFILS